MELNVYLKSFTFFFLRYIIVVYDLAIFVFDLVIIKRCQGCSIKFISFSLDPISVLTDKKIVKAIKVCNDFLRCN